MNVINTVAPIAIEDLKKYFADKNTFFNIDYKNSKLKTDKLLVYLSNIDLPVDINFSDCTEEEIYDMLKTYLNSVYIVNIKSLEILTIKILHEYRKIIDSNIYTNFIEDNKEILNIWLSRLDSLTLYNMYTIKCEEFRTFINQFAKDDTEDLTGINFVSLLKHVELYALFDKINTEKLIVYTKYFDEYIFKGKNLYSYWANENNPLFILTYGISEGIITGKEYAQAVKEDQEILNVSSV